MKLFTTFSLIALFALFTSCEKARTCNCDVNGQTVSTELNEGTKADQEDACQSIENTSRLLDPSASCNLQ
jgi:hypothetical protein